MEGDIAMDKKQLNLILLLLDLALKYGVPTAISIIENIEKENVSLEDIQALRVRVPKPEVYFGN